MAESEAVGAAQHPSLRWATNPPPCRRSVEEATALLKRYSRSVPDYVRIFLVESLGKDTYAQYGAFTSSGNYSWEDMFVPKGADIDWIPIKVRANVFDSDEAIVAVLSHELFEIEKLEEEFKKSKTISGAKLIQMIGPGVEGNLHSQAWDHADDMVRKMRESKESADGI